MVGKTVMTRNLDCEWVFLSDKPNYPMPRFFLAIETRPTRTVTQGLPPFVCAVNGKALLGCRVPWVVASPWTVNQTPSNPSVTHNVFDQLRCYR
jgi:hypothetical protein